MSLTALLNRELTLVRRTDEGETDVYGNPAPTEELVPVVGELQQVRRDEPDDNGELSDTNWLLILPAGTAVNTGDALVCDGQLYEVVGDPWQARNPRTGVASHIEATCRRTGSAGDEVTGS